VILIEQHLMGPRKADCTCETGDGSPRGQCGYVPVEWLDNNYDAIVMASNAGIIVVEPAGNGEQELDNPIYDDRFNRAWRDPGAIMVAGGSSASRTKECFTNHGDRIDLHGWGENVATTGYGDGKRSCLGNPSCMSGQESRVGGWGDRNQYYTSSFNGTSSASPIVAGAVAAIRGVQLANRNPPLTWLEMRELLVSTGSPPEPGHDIGPLPNLSG
jgi:serine protease